MKVGDKVWYVPSDSRHPNPEGSYLEVGKVGRKYFYIKNGYHDLKCETGHNNGYAFAEIAEWPYGSIYECEEDYLAFKEWNSLNFNQKLTREQKDAIVKIIKGGFND